MMIRVAKCRVPEGSHAILSMFRMLLSPRQSEYCQPVSRSVRLRAG